MNILVVGKRNILCWHEHVADAFNELGHKVVLFEHNKPPILKKLYSYYLRQVRYGNPSLIIAGEFRRCVVDTKPDIIVFVSALFVPEEIYIVLKEINYSGPIIGWVGDKFSSSHLIKLNMLDHVYMTDSAFSEQAIAYGYEKSSYLPLAYNDKYYFDENLKRKDRIVFIGAYNKNRSELLCDINNDRMTVIGPKWENLGNKKITINNRKINRAEVVRIYNTHTAVLNISQNENVINGLSMRCFEAAACGAAVVTDNLGDIDFCFNRGEEILVYNDASELSEVINRLQTDRKMIQRVAKSGQQRVRAEHTYKHRVEKIINDLS